MAKYLKANYPTGKLKPGYILGEHSAFRKSLPLFWMALTWLVMNTLKPCHRLTILHPPSIWVLQVLQELGLPMGTESKTEPSDKDPTSSGTSTASTTVATAAPVEVSFF